MMEIRKRTATALAFLLTGCMAGDEADEYAGGEVIREDSASVSIVTDPRPSADLSTYGVLDLIPSVVMGGVEGDGPHLFSGVGDVVSFPGGELVVADASSREVRVFTDDGDYRFTVGGPGDGPGEFTSIGRLRSLVGGRLAVWDDRSLRVSYFDSAGALEGTHSVPEARGPWPALVEFLQDGRIVVGTHLLDEPEPRGSGWYPRVDSLIVRILSADGTEEVPVGRFPGIDRAMTLEDLGGGRIIIRNPERPFAHRTHVSASESGVLVMRSDPFEIRSYGTAGNLEAIWRMPGLEEPLSPDEVSAYRSRVGDGSDGVAMMEDLGTPTRRPPFRTAIVANDGLLWVKQYRSNPEADQTWWVISQRGEVLGQLTVPASLEIRAVGEDRMVAVVEDELGVERIEAYEVRRP